VADLERSRAGRSAFSLIVPMFDEEVRLLDYGKALLDFITEQPAGSELIFVDDGSTDRTVETVADLLAARRDAPARVIRRPHEGKGAAVSAGLAEVHGEYAGFCDLDLSTPLDQLERVMDAAMRAPALAIGSRDLPASRMLRAESPIRETLGRAYNLLLQATLTPGVVDTQCGAKAASREVWRTLLPHCHETGYAWDAELISVAKALRIDIIEVPVAWRHDDRSRVHLGRDGAAMVLATPRIRRRARAITVAHRPVPARPTDTTPSTEVFDDANAEQLAGADRSHWWFRSKAAFVSTALRRTAHDLDGDGWLVDAGGGSGAVTAMLGWRPDRTIVVEGNATLSAIARNRYALNATRGIVDRMPLRDNSALVVCLLDVIEHLTDPVAALSEARRVLSDDGVIVINVPAHRWLWSAADVTLGHKRRYDRALLRAQLADAGLEPILITHVFSWLVLPVWLKRRVASTGQAELGLDQTSVPLDLAAMVLTRLERTAITRVSLPVGTSVLCVARPAAASVTTPPHPVRETMVRG
jgi:dolichyl-phosphate beta-glucosyltransferase